MKSVLVTGGLLIAAPAFAQDATGEGEAEGTAQAEVGVETPATAPPSDGMVVWTARTWPTELNEQPLVNAGGMFQIHLDAFINLSKDKVFEPFAIAPDIYYGLSDKLTVGLTHNVGLCLTGEDTGCTKVYNDVGLAVRYLITRTPKMEVAAAGAVDAVTIDPLAIGIRIGALTKFKLGQKLALFVDPSVKIGVTEREGTTVGGVTTGGNIETLAIPVRLSFQQSLKLALYLETGLVGAPLAADLNPGATFENFGDAFAIPLGIGVQFGISPAFDIGAEFALPGLIWPGRPDMAPGPVDGRTLTIFANYRI